MFIILNLLLIFGISILVVASFKFSTIRWIVSFLFSLFINLQLGSLYIGGSLIDYKFYVHFNLRDMVSMTDFFLVQILSVLLTLMVFSITIYWLSNKVIKHRLYSTRLFRYATIFASILILSFRGGIINNLFKTAQILIADDLGFNVALKNLGMDTYVASDEVEAEGGKNIIIISLESYERGYLSDEMKELAPNMRSLSKRWNYYDMMQTSGSGWTSASLYTYLTGIPAFFKGNGNLVFKKSQYSHITGISHVLKKAGYDMTYLVGNAEFAGTKDLLNAFQITDIIDHRKLKDKYETNSSWGIHDKDLFEEAKLEIRAKVKSNDPFAIFLSTISTHNPNGVYDNRMEALVNPQKSNLEFMAASVDNIVGDFIGFLESEGILDNTIVYIFPDHLKMGDGSMFRKTGERGLFLITNASNLEMRTNTIYQIDLPKIILKGAAIKTNASFLTTYIDGDKEDFILKNSAAIASLNSAGLVREGFWDEDLNIEINRLGEITVWSGEEHVVINADNSKNLISSLSFSSDMRLEEITYHTKERSYTPIFDITLNIYMNDGLLITYFQKEGRTPLLKVNNRKIVYSIEELRTIDKLIKHKKAGLFMFESDEIIEVSSSAKNDYLQFLVNIPYDITEAIIEVEYSTIGDAAPYVIVYGQPYNSSTIALHDRLQLSRKKSSVQISFNKFVSKPALVFRNWSKKGEFIVTKYKIYGRGYDNSIANIRKTVHFDKYSTDVNRFIAHAGGSIDGKTYTNSLEALNNSYEKGFRLFELDIIKTSDGKYVAAHDWNHWSKITGFQGALSISEKEFLKHKIHGNYTPMNMELINSWFNEHQDAILVTDKVNEPKQFAQVFIDKSRLMMELFSIEAVKEGIDLGIRSSMASEKVVNSLGKDKVSALKSLGVKNIVVSRRFIASNILFLQRLKESDIKTYVFHVNFDDGKDENYVVNYEMEYIYGLYADNWDFK